MTNTSSATSGASGMTAADVLAFSPPGRQPGYDAGEGQQIRGFRAVGAGMPRLHGMKVPLIDMRLRVAEHAAMPTPAMVIARLDGRIMAILVDDIAELLPAPPQDAAQDSLVGVAEPGQHSMVLLAVEKLAPPPRLV